MIAVRIQGGLGNQMFQYACGLSVARAKGVPLKLDLSWFDEVQDGAPRPYQLAVFNITTPTAVPTDFLRAGIPSQRHNLLATLVRRAIRFLDTHRPLIRRKVVLELGTAFTPELFNVRDNCLLNGNWQSEKYFISIADIIRKEFTLKNGFGEEAAEIAKQIQKETRRVPVSLHIRRGDSVSIAHSMSFHGSPDTSYYLDAVALMREKVGNPVFYVFSDDIPWVEEHLLPKIGTAVIVSSPGIKDAEDIVLMGLCSHHITAHSSFSWWGAWLDPKKDKVVIGPKRWYKQEVDTSDLTPKEWVRIENKLL